MLEKMKEERQFSTLAFDEMKFVEKKVAFVTISLNLFTAVLKHPDSDSFVKVSLLLRLIFQ